MQSKDAFTLTKNVAIEQLSDMLQDEPATMAQRQHFQ